MTFQKRTDKYLKAIDLPMLFFLNGIFIMSGVIQLTGLFLIFNPLIEQLLTSSPFLGIATLSNLIGLMSSVVENVSMLALTRPLIDTASIYNARLVWWTVLATVSINDSLLLISSVKGLYILEAARKEGIKIKFWEYTKYGVLITVIQLIGAMLYLALLLLIIPA